MLMLGKLWKYTDHTIVFCDITKQDQHTIKLQTFDAYHPILSLTHRLAVLLYSALVSLYCMVLCIVAFNGAVA